ncbi:hypothetical protein T06_9640, partial [Trichinella sp. T6]
MQFGAFWINMMGGVALRKLSYIAIKVAKKHKPTLNNKLYTTPPDYAYLDELIKKYFPDEIGNFRGVYLVHLYGPVTSGSNKRGYLIRWLRVPNHKSCFPQLEKWMKVTRFTKIA